MKYLRSNGQPAVKLCTVNVVEITNGDVQSVRSFTDNKDGNKRAEKLFGRIVAEHYGPVDKEDLDNMLSDGIFDDDNGYQVLLTHSI